MIEIAPRQLPASSDWFTAGGPGPAVVGEHALGTGHGRWWGDRSDRPRVVAVCCAGHTVLRGDPAGLDAAGLAPFAHTRIDAPAAFLPLLGAAFERITPVARMVWTQVTAPQRCAAPHGVRVRRLEPADADALAALGPGAARITAGWGGPLGLAAAGHGWAAVGRDGRLLAVACSFFRGVRYEEVAVRAASDRRGHRPALSCVAALSADIRGRGHAPSWNCSTADRPGRLLAWTSGFRLVREYVGHAAGAAVGRSRTNSMIFLRDADPAA